MLLFKIESKSNLYVFIFLFLTLDSAQRYALPSPKGHIHTFIYVLAIPLHIYIKKCVCEQKWLFYLKKYFFYFLHSTPLNDMLYPPLKGIFIHLYMCSPFLYIYIYKEMRMRAKMIFLFKKIFFYFLHSTALNDMLYPSLKGIFIHLYMCSPFLYIYI